MPFRVAPRPALLALPIMAGPLRLLALALAVLALVLAQPAAAADDLPFSPGLALHGAPQWPQGMPHYPYANPAAPKGGRIVIGQSGTFDSLNPYASRGAVPDFFAGYLYQTLMHRSLDEPFTLYGLVADGVHLSPDRRVLTFRLHPDARFSDGAPLTAEDVAFTFGLLKEKGRPLQRGAYRRVKTVEVLSPRLIRYTLEDARDLELPMLLAIMPVLARHATQAEGFELPTLRPPLGSGPYVLAELQPGQSFTLRRNPNAWSRDLPTTRGFHNLDEIRVDFYRDANALFEAFKVGLVDYRLESDAGRWQEGYDFPAMREGRTMREALTFRAPRGMSGFVFNTRRPLFQQEAVRRGLAEMFDFEWINRNFFQGLYRRMASYFDASDLASTGRPASEAERALLAAAGAAILPEIMEGTWQPPSTDGSGRDRAQLQRALAHLRGAGYQIVDGQLRQGREGEVLAFDIMVLSREQERVALAFSDALKPIGVNARVRLVDSSEYWRRLRVFDYDMVIWSFPVSASPGNEQSNRWSSGAADRPSSLNLAGVRSAAIDRLIEALLAARTREAFVDAVRALDRALLSGTYVIPLYFTPERWIARSATLKRPDTLPVYDFTIDTWWREPAAATPATGAPARP